MLRSFGWPDLLMRPFSGSPLSLRPPIICYLNWRRQSSSHSSLVRKNALFSVLDLQFSVSPSSNGVNALKTSTSGVSSRVVSLQAQTLGVLRIARRRCPGPISKTRTGPPSNFPILHNPIGTLGVYEAQVEMLRLGHLERIHRWRWTRNTSVPRPVYRTLAADPLSAPMPLTVRITSLVNHREILPVEASNKVMATSWHEQTKLSQKSRSTLETHFWMVPNSRHDPSIRIRGFPPGNRLQASWMRRATRLLTRQWNRCALPISLKRLMLTFQ